MCSNNNIIIHTLAHNICKCTNIIDRSPIRIYDREQGNGMATKKHGAIIA